MQISVQYIGVDNLWSQTLVYEYIISYIMWVHFIKLLHFINKQEQHFAFARMGNLSDLLPNATPLVKCQRNVSFKATVFMLTLRRRQPVERLCIASIHMCTTKLRQTFR
jgi:hypothetical protein